jgi:hypothetical protein
LNAFLASWIGRPQTIVTGVLTKDVTTTRFDSLHRRSLSDGWVPSIVGALSRRSTTDIEEIGIGALITANGLKVLAHQAGQIE